METTKNNIYDSFRPKMSMSAWVKTIVPVERQKEVLEALYAYAEKEGIKLPALKTKIVNLDVAKDIASIVYKVMGEEAPNSEVKKETPKKLETKKEVPSNDLKFAKGTPEAVKDNIRKMVKELGHRVPDWVVFCEAKIYKYPKLTYANTLHLPEDVDHIDTLTLGCAYDYKSQLIKAGGSILFNSLVSDDGWHGNPKDFFKLAKAIKEAVGIELPDEKFLADNVYDYYKKCIDAITLIEDGYVVIDADVKSNLSTLKKIVGKNVKSSFEEMIKLYADHYPIRASNFITFVKKNYVKSIKTSVGTFTFLTAYSKYPQCTSLEELVYYLVQEYKKK